MVNDTNLVLAKQQFLDAGEISENKLLDICSSLTGPAIDDADLYFQSTRSESWVIEDGIVKEGTFNIERGAGVRVISGEKTGFAYSDEIALVALSDAGKAARSIAQAGQQQMVQMQPASFTPCLYDSVNPLSSMPNQDKVALLQSVDTMARARDPRVKQVIASLNGSYTVIMLMTAQGVMVADVRPLVRFGMVVVVEQNGRRETGREGFGGRYDYQTMFECTDIKKASDKAVDCALANLDAVPAPAGEMTVVLGPGWPGVLLHEAIGHGLEGDFCRKGTSAFSGRIGEQVADSAVTVVDDGSLENRRGSLTIDDEGVATSCTTLIENGVLKEFMQDKLNARLMGVHPTGNGRRQSYAHLPMPRMTNTYMLPGQHAPDEIIASVKDGVYAVNFGGGQVDITSGKFVFSASEAYKIENGKVGAPLKGMSLIGNGPDVLTRVSMVGNDLRLDDGVGVCGKNGQMVPVGVGQPTLRVDGITVGGTA